MKICDRCRDSADVTYEFKLKRVGGVIDGSTLFGETKDYCQRCSVVILDEFKVFVENLPLVRT